MASGGGGGGGAAAAATPTVAELLQRASEAQAAAAAAVASGTTARGDADRLTAAAELAQTAAISAVTAAAAAAGLTVGPAAGGAGAAVPLRGSILEKISNWIDYIRLRTSTLAGMAYTRWTAPTAPNSLETIKGKLDKAIIKDAPIFSIIDPSTPGREAALIASRTSYMLESKLLDDYMNFEIAIDRFGKSKTNPNIAIFTDILGQSIFLYSMSIHKKNRLRIPLEIEAAKGGAGGKLVRGYSGPTNTKGVRIELPPYLMDKINVAIRDMDVNYKMGEDDIIVAGTAGPSATPPSIRGASDLRLDGLASYLEWLNSDYYKALETHYDSLLSSITAATASIRRGVSTRGPDIRPLFDRLIGRGGSAVGTSSSGSAGGISAPNSLAKLGAGKTGDAGAMMLAAAPAATALNLFAAPSGGSGGGGVSGGPSAATAAASGRGLAGGINWQIPDSDDETAARLSNITRQLNRNTGAATHTGRQAAAPGKRGAGQGGGARHSLRHRKTRRHVHTHKSRKAKTHNRSRARKTRRRQH